MRFLFLPRSVSGSSTVLAKQRFFSPNGQKKTRKDFFAKDVNIFFGRIMSVMSFLVLFCSGVELFGADPMINVLDHAKLSDFNGHLIEKVPLDQVFSISSGILSVKKEPRGWLETKKSWHNFTVCAEVRYPNGPNKVNSGLFLRVNGEHYLGYSPRSVEVQLEPKSIGLLMSFYDMKMTAPEDRFSINRKHWSGVRRTVERFDDPDIKDYTQWQRLEVTCYEDLVVVRVNGKIINWAEGIENISGRIGFQSEGGAVDFRNVIIKDTESP